MTPKAILAASLLCALALAGCTGGSDEGGGGTSTSTSGTGSVGGCVTANGSGACANATASGSATATSTGSVSNTTTGAPGNGTMENRVTIQGNAYNPADITVPIGATVTWEHNDGNTAHTVTADDGSFDSSPGCNGPLPIGDCMVQGDEFTHTFTTVGDFPYHDKLDTSITGIVRVTAE